MWCGSYYCVAIHMYWCSEYLGNLYCMLLIPSMLQYAKDSNGRFWSSLATFDRPSFTTVPGSMLKYANDSFGSWASAPVTLEDLTVMLLIPSILQYQ